MIISSLITTTTTNIGVLLLLTSHYVNHRGNITIPDISQVIIINIKIRTLLINIIVYLANENIAYQIWFTELEVYNYMRCVIIVYNDCGETTDSFPLVLVVVKPSQASGVMQRIITRPYICVGASVFRFKFVSKPFLCLYMFIFNYILMFMHLINVLCIIWHFRRPSTGVSVRQNGHKINYKYIYILCWTFYFILRFFIIIFVSLKLVLSEMREYTSSGQLATNLRQMKRGEKDQDMRPVENFHWALIFRQWDESQIEYIQFELKKIILFSTLIISSAQHNYITLHALYMSRKMELLTRRKLNKEINLFRGLAKRIPFLESQRLTPTLCSSSTALCRLAGLLATLTAANPSPTAAPPLVFCCPPLLSLNRPPLLPITHMYDSRIPSVHPYTACPSPPTYPLATAALLIRLGYTVARDTHVILHNPATLAPHTANPWALCEANHSPASSSGSSQPDTMDAALMS
ncbi:hypothetical protein VP01_495g2 [Puccinia sorghi]|uniref:Uncharacterized protein n=1 Tax=Puccinia sorghi TaxID=27349 RepID=A0A0L6UMP4_9BASI|nr:hypothetical protein VP01_495g2 [Puccinia sorghi]